MMNNKSISQKLVGYMTLIGAQFVAASCVAAGPNFDNARAIESDGTIREMSEGDREAGVSAAEYLSEQLSVDVEDIEIDSVRSVDWSDTSIGCPQPDQAYGQVITPGHKVTLRHEGQIHVVHEANGRALICDKTKRVADVTANAEFVWAKQALIARAELAETIGVPISAIRVESARRVTWQDTGLGCPGPTDIAARIDGYQIVLRHKVQRYTFHTDLNRVVACPAIATD